MAFGSEVLAEKKVLSETQKKALRSYIMKKKKKELEDKTSSDQVGGTNTSDDNDDEDNPHSPDSKTVQSQSGQESSTSSLDTPYNTPVKGNDDSLESVTEQLKSLREKLEGLKKEKHQLFQELKKVLHEEDEKKRQQQLEQQRLCHGEQEAGPSFSHSMSEGSMVMYRGDPRLGKAGMKHPWTSYGSPEPLPQSKLPRSSSLQEMANYPQQQQPPHPVTYGNHPTTDQDKYLNPPYHQRVPPQSHMIRPQAMSPGLAPGYHQFRGGHFGGYAPSNTNQYGGGHPPYHGGTPGGGGGGGGFIQSPGPHPPPDMMPGQMYHPPHHHHQQPQQPQYMSQQLGGLALLSVNPVMPTPIHSQQMVPSHDFSPQSHFSFEPHQSRFMIRGQRPPLKMGPFSPQRDQGSSPSHSPLPSTERMRYIQQQRHKK